MVDVVGYNEVAHVEGGFEKEDVLMKQVKQRSTI
jgi:hypothetical protein